MQKVFPPGIEPGTLSVLDSRDNHYTTETRTIVCQKEHHKNKLIKKVSFLEPERYWAYTFRPVFVTDEDLHGRSVLLSRSTAMC